MQNQLEKRTNIDVKYLHLQIEWNVENTELFHFKVDTYRGFVLSVEHIVTKSANTKAQNRCKSELQDDPSVQTTEHLHCRALSVFKIRCGIRVAKCVYFCLSAPGLKQRCQHREAPQVSGSNSTDNKPRDAEGETFWPQLRKAQLTC